MATKATTAKKQAKKVDPKYLGIPNICFSLVSKDDDREKRFCEQRLSRGFDDSETWSLCDTIANFVIPRLERFQKISQEVDANPLNVKKTLRAMKLITRDRGSRIFTKKEQKEVEEGLQDFANIFLGLWW